MLSPVMSCPPLPGKGRGGEIPMEFMLCLWAESGRVDNFSVSTVSPLPSAQNNFHAKMAYFGVAYSDSLPKLLWEVTYISVLVFNPVLPSA